MYPSAFHRVVEMPHSPTHLQRDIVRRHLTGSWKIFTGYATITDRINPSVYFKREYFFGAQFMSVKPSVIFFFTNRLSDEIWYYRRTVSRRTFFVDDLVGKKITDELWITDRWNMSIGKTVKSCSVSDIMLRTIIIVKERMWKTRWLRTLMRKI